MMKYADFMAFPFPQHQLINKQGKLEIDQNVILDVCQTTSVPPFLRKMEDIVREHCWFLDQIGKQEQKRRTAFFFGLQNPPIDASVSDLLVLKGLGIRFMTLAYEGANEYGGGFAAPDEPLTDKGKALIWNMAYTGMVLDLSHAGHRTAREAIFFMKDISLDVRYRVVASHAACFDLYKHDRALPDDILKGISDLDGLIGISTVAWMLDEKDDSIQPFLRHLDHLVDLVGERSVCLGTDGVYRHLDPKEGEERFKTLKEKIDPRGVFRARYPEQSAELNCADRMMVLERFLRSHGWFESRIEKIMGKNLIRFFSNL